VGVGVVGIMGKAGLFEHGAPPGHALVCAGFSNFTPSYSLHAAPVACLCRKESQDDAGWHFVLSLPSLASLINTLCHSEGSCSRVALGATLGASNSQPRLFDKCWYLFLTKQAQERQ